jgi:hypothetical protein
MDVRPFQIVSLLDMHKLNSETLLWFIRSVEHYFHKAPDNKAVLTEEARKQLKITLDLWLQHSTFLNLPVSASQIKRTLKKIGEPQCTTSDFRTMVIELRSRIDDEIEAVAFMYIPPHEANYCKDEPHFGEQVSNKFPKTVGDIQEAAKCFGVGRYTASVFHLMRVMEFATQHLGKRLNITLVNEKRWHNILDEVDKAIKALPIGSSRLKAKRNRLAEASAHLRMVKDAWRNDVMHPKETYTPEEAERIFRNVKDFMVHLATKL